MKGFVMAISIYNSAHGVKLFGKSIRCLKAMR